MILSSLLYATRIIILNPTLINGNYLTKISALKLEMSLHLTVLVNKSVTFDNQLNFNIHITKLSSGELL